MIVGSIDFKVCPLPLGVRRNKSPLIGLFVFYYYEFMGRDKKKS